MVLALGHEELSDLEGFSSVPAACLALIVCDHIGSSALVGSNPRSSAAEVLRLPMGRQPSMGHFYDRAAHHLTLLGDRISATADTKW